MSSVGLGCDGGLRRNGNYKKSCTDKPLVTIITVVFNGDKFLGEAIQSVLNQTYSNIEYVVVDGGSNDGTLGILSQYQDRIDYWISEPDNGIYDAMNKGIQLATGDIVCILNADDMMFPNAVQYAVSHFLSQGVDFYFAPVFFKQGLSVGYHPEKLKYGLDYIATAHSGGFYVRRSVHERYGAYDCNFNTSADYDFFLRIIRAGCSGIGGGEDELGGIFRPGGHSGKRGYIDAKIEETRIRLNNNQTAVDILVFLLVSIPIQISSRLFRKGVSLLFAWYK